MKRTDQCPKCGSGDIIRDGKPISAADYSALLVTTYRKPDAVIFKGRETSRVSAWICGDCGYMELYADNPKGIRV